jgi:hypothetical protein
MNTNIEMMNRIAEVIETCKARKTGTHELFAKISDFKENEVEMLEYIISTCGVETIVAVEQAIESNKNLWERVDCSHTYAGILINDAISLLNKTYLFGWKNTTLVNSLDTVEDISAINMKPRHTAYLTAVSDQYPQAIQVFLNGYNQAQKHNNPDFIRAEQAIAYMRNELEREGNKLPYSDYHKACIHIDSIGIPAYDKKNWGWFVVDSNGGISPDIWLLDDVLPSYMRKYITKEPMSWNYSSGSFRNSFRYCTTKEQAEAWIGKLVNLNKITNYPVQFHIEHYHIPSQNFITSDELPNFDSILVPKGQYSKARQAVKEVRKYIR